MDSTAVGAGVRPPAQLFSRESSGFVRIGTPWRMLLLNVANIGVVYIMFTYWAHPAVFPKSNLLIAIPVAAAIALFFNLLYGMFAAIMPRTGSEYVFLTRTFHPVVGFMASFAAATSQAFWVGVGGYWIAQFVLGPMMTSFGAITGNSVIADIGEFGSKPDTWLGFGIAFALLMAAVNFFGLRAYLRFQDINWVIGGVTGALTLILLFAASNSTFQANWDAYASSQGIASYQRTLELARESGMPTDFSIWHTLAIFPILWLVSWCSTYIGSEVRTPAKTQLRATVGGWLLYAGIAWVLMVALTRSVSLDFNQAATWLSYNYGGEETIEFAPTFLLYTGLLIDNIPLLLMVGFGYVLWSYFWIPSAMIISTRAMFSWSFDRLMPEKLSAVHPRYNSPYVAVMLVTALAILFVVLFRYGIFEFLAPALAYFFVFWLVSLAGVVFPYLRKTRDLWRNSSVNWTFAGIPVMTICGVIGLFIWSVALYLAMTEDLLFLNSTRQLVTTGLQFAVPFVIFWVAWFVRRRQGIDLAATYGTLPPE